MSSVLSVVPSAVPSVVPSAVPSVVILGGGFGGIEAAKALRRAAVRVTLVDRHNHHLFQPLLYQVAMAGLSPADIAWPIRSILRDQANASVRMGEVTGIDLARRLVMLDEAAAASTAPQPVTIPYDYLVLALGSRTVYFGHDDWAAHAVGLKTIEDALEIRRRVLTAFERAETTADGRERQALMTFVIVGGGPTGVELAGALRELARFVLASDFRAIDPASARVVLLEGGRDILSAFPPDLVAAARRQLAALGVEVHVEALVTHVDSGGATVRMPDAAEPNGFREARFESGTVIWAAGVAATPLTATLGVPTDLAGRISVEADLSVPGQNGVFAIGDLAVFTHQTGQPLPGISPVAMQMGRHAAANIVRLTRGQPTQPFRYRDKGMLATIGRSAAVGRVGKLKLRGWLAWMVWWSVHIFFLIGFRNRFIVLFEWVWSYFTYSRGARLITEQHRPPDPRPPP